MSKTTPTYSTKELNFAKEQQSSTILIRLKSYLERVQKEWRPLLLAKENLDDEYNFPPGRLFDRP
ncbi:hypothetical protein N7510_002410 [Penicillium lagena]|uniref:uncharacterized protein n=1 Tax=Penicillium lagena TaxID=94218 RepID=UPI0025422C9E|nr:uncharacterized protein N7510_002410 [Penicillium lagena]KAJ5626101.1 hypothetical protein N7510_002410 [Penicillium lagena]